MSKDKHKGVARRKFALACLPLTDSGRRLRVFAPRGDPVAGKGGELNYHQRPTVDITKELRQLEKAGVIKRKRTSPVGSSFGQHIRRTRLVSP